MRTAGLRITDVWAGRLLREHGLETETRSDLPVEISVLVDAVDLNHRGPEENFRPYIHFSGELRSVRLEEPLAHGIDEITFEAGEGEKIDAYYEFDDEQLVDLTRKGYFDAGFQVPDQVRDIEWELPARARAFVVSPASVDQVPLVFVQVEDSGDLTVDLASSGYDLTEYFDDFSRHGAGTSAPQVSADGLRIRSDELDSLFETEVQTTFAEQPSPDPAVEPEPEDELDAQFSTIEAELAAEREVYEQEVAQVPGSPAQLYAERVAQAVEIDADEKGETSGSRLDQLKAEVASRAEDLSFDEDEDELAR